MTFTALVLAGARPGMLDPVAAASGVSHKALVPVAGVPMLERVVQTLASCRSVGGIVVLIENPEVALEIPALKALAKRGRLRVQRAADSPSRSVAAAIETGEFPFLVTTADHALLTTDMVEAFETGVAGDVSVGLVPSDTILAAYPESKRTWLRFSDAFYSGANLFALNTPLARNAVRFWAQVEQDRKRPWRLIRKLGPRALAQFLLRRLSLKQAFEQASRIFGAQAVAVSIGIAEAAIDVDKVSDLRQAEAILARR